MRTSSTPSPCSSDPEKPAVSGPFFLSLREGVSVSRDEGELVLHGFGGRITFRRLGRGTSAALQELIGEGQFETRLYDLVLQDGGAGEVARFAYYLERLDRRGLLLRSACDGSTR